MELHSDQQQGIIFPGVDVNPESWRYTAIRKHPQAKRNSGHFSRGKPVVCEAFGGVWAEGLIIDVRGDNPPALAICLKYGVSTLCDKCDSGCGDRYWAFSDWGGVLTREDLDKIIERSRSLATSIPNCGVDAYRQAMRLLEMIEGLEARQKGC